MQPEPLHAENARIVPLRVGLIEDDPVMGGSIVQRLELEGCAVRWWQTGQDALKAAGPKLAELDLMLCDMRLPDMDGEDIYLSMGGSTDRPPFIFITGYGEIDQAVKLMRLGASDYLTKPFDFDDFLTRVREQARSRARTPDGVAVLGVSAAMTRLEDLLARCAGTDLPVLITGETGVGKEVAARVLHDLRSSGTDPFMAVNCAAIPADLLESEIFGHEAGAFSGATKRHLGYAERAKSGTLFLDEIGDMPTALQAKILRLIEDRSFHRIGGETGIPFRGRIITATHQTLDGSVADTDFRQDLYYRIAVLTAHIPPLRDRQEDIPWLMRRLLAGAAARQERKFRGFSQQAEDMAVAHPWPGNVRELRNRIERAVALSTGDQISEADLFPDASIDSDRTEFQPLSKVREAAERRQIERALSKTTGHIRDAAQLLGISRTTLWEKMTRLGISWECPET